MTKRIYVINDSAAGKETVFLVNAATAAQAIGHVLKARYTASVVKQHQLVKLMQAGVKEQEVGDE
jgi:hypothetical protein